MGAGSTTGSVARKSSSGMRVGLLSALALAAIIVVPATAFAGKGSVTQPWIALRSVNGAAAATAPTLGSWVAFAAAYPTNVKNPRIEVDCYQGGTLVFGMAGSVNDSFLLGGGGSLWLTNGGAAQCTATLFYFGTKGGAQTYNVMATTAFDAV